MVLGMSRPWKHPKTGVYLFRKAVPEIMRKLVGRVEIRRSLRTKDPREAALRHPQVTTKVALEWEALKSGPSAAYSGARVGELAQLRRQEVRMEQGHWTIHLTPEAGTIKTNEARTVVLHLHVVELGFPEFAQAAQPGHLFLKPTAARLAAPLQDRRHGGWHSPAGPRRNPRACPQDGGGRVRQVTIKTMAQAMERLPRVI